MRSLSLFVVLLFSIPVIGQDYLGEDVDLYKGVWLKIMPMPKDLQKRGYHGFYSRPKESKWDRPKIIKPASPESPYNTAYEKLVDREFFVWSIENVIDSKTKFYFELRDRKNETIYYEYDTQINSSPFPFKIDSGLIIPPNFYCKKIAKQNDKFTGEIKFSTPVLDDVHFIKTINKADTTYYLLLTTRSPVVHSGEGVILLFSDGTKIERPEKRTKVDVSDKGGFIHTAIFSLTQNELAIFSNKKLTDFRLYIHDQSVAFGEKYSEYVKCLLNLK